MKFCLLDQWQMKKQKERLARVSIEHPAEHLKSFEIHFFALSKYENAYFFLLAPRERGKKVAKK